MIIVLLGNSVPSYAGVNCRPHPPLPIQGWGLSILGPRKVAELDDPWGHFLLGKSRPFMAKFQWKVHTIWTNFHWKVATWPDGHYSTYLESPDHRNFALEFSGKSPPLGPNFGWNWEGKSPHFFRNSPPFPHHGWGGEGGADN